MERYALLIGCNAGRGLPPLKHAHSDTDRVGAMLLRHTGWSSERIVSLTDAVTSEHVEQAVTSLLGRMCRDDFLLVYYAGHATTSADDLSLILSERPYSARRLVERCLLQNPQCGAMLVLDCCQSGRAISSGLKQFFERWLPHEHKEPSEVAGPRAIFAACAPSESAWENDEGGYLTSAFLDGCERGGRLERAHDSGVVNTSTLGRYIRQRVEKSQHAEVLLFGGFDIKTTLEWRLRAKGRRHYTPESFALLPEETRLWPSAPESTSELVSAHWAGDPFTVAVGCRGQLARIYQLDQLARALPQQGEVPAESASRGIKLSVDGKLAAIYRASGDSIHVSSTSTHRVNRDYAVTINQHAIISRGWVITADAQSSAVAIWARREPEPIALDDTHHTRSVAHLRVFPDENHFVTGGLDGRVFVWRLDGIRENTHHNALQAKQYQLDALHPLERPFGQVRRVAIDGECERIAAGFGGTGRVRVWSIDRPEKPVSGVNFAQHGHYITALEFSPDGRYLASGCGGGQVYLTTLDSPVVPRLIWPNEAPTQDERITALAFSPSGRDLLLAIGTSRGRVALCQLADPPAQLVFLEDPRARGEVYRISLLDSLDQPVGLLLAAQGGIEAWDVVYC